MCHAPTAAGRAPPSGVCPRHALISSPPSRTMPRSVPAPGRKFVAKASFFLKTVRAKKKKRHALHAISKKRRKKAMKRAAPRAPRGGLGLFLTQSKGGGGLTVKALAQGLPAAQSDVRIGDRLVAVCGTPVGDLEPSEAIALILRQQHERLSATTRCRARAPRLRACPAWPSGRLDPRRWLCTHTHSKRIKAGAGSRPRAPDTADGLHSGIELTLERAAEREPGASHIFSVTLFPPEMPASSAECGDSAEDEAQRSAARASEPAGTSRIPTEDQLPDFVRDSLPRPPGHASDLTFNPPRPPAAAEDVPSGPQQRSLEVLEKLSLARNALLSNLTAPHPSAPSSALTSSAPPASASGLQPSPSLLAPSAPIAPHTCVAVRDAPNALCKRTHEKPEAATAPRAVPAVPTVPAAPSITPTAPGATAGPLQQQDAELATEGRTHGDETGVRLQAAMREAVALVSELGESLSLSPSSLSLSLSLSFSLSLSLFLSLYMC